MILFWGLTTHKSKTDRYIDIKIYITIKMTKYTGISMMKSLNYKFLCISKATTEFFCYQNCIFKSNIFSMTKVCKENKKNLVFLLDILFAEQLV